MASTVSFSSVGSGIDFDSVRTAIINQRSVPITQMQTKAAGYTNQAAALRQLNGMLATLTTATQNLTDRSLGTGRGATVADTTVATATASSTASLGKFNLDVSRLATSLTQSSRSYTSTTDPIIAGGGSSATFELRTGGAASGVEITLDSTNNSLAGLRDAINAKNAGVTASIVDINGDGTNQQLVLNSTATGASGRVELVETSATGTGADLNLRSLNLPDGDFSKLDAAFSINGLNLTRSTNDIFNAVTGVNLSLKKVGSTAVETTQSSEISDKLTDFVKAYNAIQDFMATQYTKDAQNRPTGILAGESTLRNVQQQLSSLVGNRSEDNGGTLSSLAQLGITTDESGKLSLDSATLNTQVNTNIDNVKSLLYGKTSADTGIFQSAYNTSNSLSDNITGSVITAINGYQNSVTRLNDTIANRTEIMTRLSDTLKRQFAAADAAIGQLNNQNTSITNIIKSLTSSN